jgi:four helix bundle protein
MRDFKTLEVWKKSHLLTLEIYRASAQFPASEMYGLTSQIRRAAASIPANIAEGCGRETDAELRRFLHIAGGSTNELEYHILLALDLDYISAEIHSAINASITEIRRMLTGFVKRLS